MDKQALLGLKVLEWGNYISAPYCTKLLADLGAEVIKIEDPGYGDKARQNGPFPGNIPHPERSGLFLYLNTNKRGITLNIKQATGRAIFKKLVENSDILVENNSPELVEELRLDYCSLKEINPRLIMTSITPFGYSGPYKYYRGYDINSSAAGGVSVSIGLPEREPLVLPLSQCHYQGGLNGAAASLVAWFARRLTGRGQHVDISEAEVMSTLVVGDRASTYVYVGITGIRRGRHHGYGMGYPESILPCKDGYICANAPLLSQWLSFLELIGNPEWAKEPRYRDRRAMAEQYPDEVDNLLAPWLIEHSKEEIFALCRKHHIPFAPVYNIEEIVNHPHLRERGFFVRINHSQTGELTYPGAPYKFSRTPWKIKRPAPLLGEHNEEIYCGTLGYAKEELVQFRRCGIV